MKFTTSFLLSLCFVLLFSPISAQVIEEKTDRAKDRAEYKVDRKVDQEIDQAVDKVFDKAASLFKRKKKKEKTTTPEVSQRSETTPTERSSQDQATPSSLFGSTEIYLAANYRFDITITMRTKTTKKSGKVKDEIDLNWMIGNQQGLFGFSTYDKKGGTVSMIYDIKDEVMISISEKDKKATAFSIKNDDSQSDTSDDESPEVTIKKTGKTKSILGYKCHEYMMDSKDSFGSFWLTPEIEGLDLSKMPSKLRKNQKNPWSDVKQPGFMMQSKVTMRDSKKSFESIATNVDKSSKSYKMSNYEVMSLGGFGF